MQSVGDARGQELRQDDWFGEEIPAGLAAQDRTRDRICSPFDLLVIALCLLSVDDPSVARETGICPNTDLHRQLLAVPPGCSEETLDWSVANPAASPPRARPDALLGQTFSPATAPRHATPRNAMPVAKHTPVVCHITHNRVPRTRNACSRHEFLRNAFPHYPVSSCSYRRCCQDAFFRITGIKISLWIISPRRESPSIHRGRIDTVARAVRSAAPLTARSMQYKPRYVSAFGTCVQPRG